MISFIVPGIRTHLWERFYNSIPSSFKGTFEVVFISPFDLPTSLIKDNVRLIKSFCTIPTCLQIGTISAKYDTICHSVDDSTFIPGALDKVLLSYDYTNPIGLTYIEYTHAMVGQDCWSVKNLSEFHLPSINLDWYTMVQPIMPLSLFKKIGGIRCEFEYSNHAHHDLAFRLQALGYTINIPDFPISTAEHMPERTGDHGPIHDAQMEDVELFNRIYSAELNPIIDLQNYQKHMGVWNRRFSKSPTSYNDLCIKEGYEQCSLKRN